MRNIAVLAIAVAIGAVGTLWIAPEIAPIIAGPLFLSIPGSPLSSPMPSRALAASAEARGLPTLAPMLRRVMPAVVSITVQAQVLAEDNPLYKDPFYRRYFGGSPRPTARPSQQVRVLSSTLSRGWC